jgi:hypothetical protein
MLIYTALHFRFKRKPAVLTAVLFFNLNLVIGNSKDNQELLKLKWKHQLMTYRDDINLLGENINAIYNVELY